MLNLFEIDYFKPNQSIFVFCDEVELYHRRMWTVKVGHHLCDGRVRVCGGLQLPADSGGPEGHSGQAGRRLR